VPHDPPAERTHSGLALHLLYPLHPKLPLLGRVPRAARRGARRTLTELAVRAHLSRCRATTFVGVTGSSGKTTTKDLLAEMLAIAGPTVMTHHNDNGLYGVPASLLSVRPGDRFAVIELGIRDQPGEMEWMAALFRPRVAVLTGVGDDHLHNFGSREAIAREKRALLARLGPHGTAVVRSDDPLARRAAAGLPCRVVLAGGGRDADVRLVSSRLRWPQGTDVELDVAGERFTTSVALHGEHLAPLVALAVAGALACGVSASDALSGAARFAARPGRLCPVRGPDGSMFLLDDFESRIPGAVAAVRALRAIPARRRIAVLGEVQECPQVASSYRPLAEALGEGVDLVLAVGSSGGPLGELLAGTQLADRLVCAPDASSAGAHLAGDLGRGDVVLVHGPVDQELGRIVDYVGGAGLRRAGAPA
jgi:UDP-N-acetylmuramyl pentapeptide synthase